jgi:hypothetical protein
VARVRHFYGRRGKVRVVHFKQEILLETTRSKPSFHATILKIVFSFTAYLAQVSTSSGVVFGKFLLREADVAAVLLP